MTTTTPTEGALGFTEYIATISDYQRRSVGEISARTMREVLTAAAARLDDLEYKKGFVNLYARTATGDLRQLHKLSPTDAWPWDTEPSTAKGRLGFLDLWGLWLFLLVLLVSFCSMISGWDSRPYDDYPDYRDFPRQLDSRFP